MFEKLGKAKYVVPLLIGIVAACVMSVMFYPMANMEMKGLPFAVLSLDEGVETPQGDMNVGDTLVENITSATAAEDGEESPIAWTKVGSQKELDEALENGEYYGAIIVPADFSAQQMACSRPPPPTTNTFIGGRLLSFLECGGKGRIRALAAPDGTGR